MRLFKLLGILLATIVGSASCICTIGCKKTKHAGYATTGPSTGATSTLPKGDATTRNYFSPRELGDNLTTGEFVKKSTVSSNKRLTLASLKEILLASKFFSTDDPSLSGWSYSPAYSGTFVSGGVTYRFILFLGGRGRITAEDGETRIFVFDPKLESARD